MLPDPILVNVGATGNTPAGATVQNFARIADGKYVGSTVGTIDEPQFFDITNRMNYNGSSTITLKSRQQKNVAAINGVPQKDDEIVVSIQVTFPHRSYTSANCTDHVIRAAALFGGYQTQLTRGER